MLHGVVVQGFGLEGRRLRREKSYYIASDALLGALVIRRSMDGPGAIEFAHEVKELLAEKGFTSTDRFIIARDGKPYVEHDGDTYTCTRYTSYLRQADFSAPQDILKAVDHVAVMHSLARGISSPNNSKEPQPDISYELERDIRYISTIKKKIRHSGSLSDFDIMFLKNYDFYSEIMLEVQKELSSTNIMQYMATARANGHILHNRLKEETILLGEAPNSVYITNFTGASRGYAMFDLASMASRYLAESNPEEQLPILAILEQYSAKNTLNMEDIRILTALLRYPHKFIRICRSHYAKRRNWTPSSILGKMQEIIEGQAHYYAQI